MEKCDFSRVKLQLKRSKCFEKSEKKGNKARNEERIRRKQQSKKKDRKKNNDHMKKDVNVRTKRKKQFQNRRN